MKSGAVSSVRVKLPRFRFFRERGSACGPTKGFCGLSQDQQSQRIANTENTVKHTGFPLNCDRIGKPRIRRGMKKQEPLMMKG